MKMNRLRSNAKSRPWPSAVESKSISSSARSAVFVPWREWHG
jgi:hypothetical protein